MSETASEASSEAVITKAQSLGITLSSIIGAAAVFIVTIITPKVLSIEENNQFLVFWALMFGVFGALLGIQQEVTRAVGEAQTTLVKQVPAQNVASESTRVIPVAAFWGLIIAGAFLGSSALWGESILGEGYFLSVFLIAVGTVFYACHVSVVGTAAGSGNWSIFAWLGGWESVLRLALTGIVAITVGSLWGFKFAAIAPVLLWLALFAVSAKSRRALGSQRVAMDFKLFARNMGWSILTSAAYAVMVTGFPVLVKATTGTPATAQEQLLLGAVLIGINLTRAPIMIPLQMFQGVAVSAFLKQRNHPMKALFKPTIALLGVGIVGAIAAYLIGPFLFDLLYYDYRETLSGAVLGALTFASAFMAVVVLTGTAALATSKHRLYLGGWVATVAVSVAMLLLPLPLEGRVILALIAGPLCGALIHIAGLVLSPANTSKDKADTATIKENS